MKLCDGQLFLVFCFIFGCSRKENCTFPPALSVLSNEQEQLNQATLCVSTNKLLQGSVNSYF